MSTDQVFYLDTAGLFSFACVPVMAKKTMAKNIQPSPELLAANQRLLALRQQQTCREPEVDSLDSQAREPLTRSELSELPAHLGWGSAAFTAVLRRHQAGLPTRETKPGCQDPQTDSLAACLPDHRQILTGSLQSKIPGESASVKLYPDIGLAMLRQEKATAGRLWLMCHYLDSQRGGVLRIDNIIQSITTKSSVHYLCGKRQLRNLLRAGEGVYWTRDKERLWLRSAARVAAALGVERLTGQPVALPLSALLSGIGAFRAHLYAAFHSGRAKSEARRSAMPIARDTLAGLSGVGRTSQRSYEARVGIQPLANFAIGEAATERGQEERAWRQGQALFTLQDYDGQQGRQGKTYLAWQLPNSYTGQHALRPKGRQKRINRQLQDLVMKGMPGNEGDLAGRPAAGQQVAAKRRPVAATRRYYPNGRAAGQRRSKNGAGPVEPCYWRAQGVGNGRFALWHSLEKA